MLSKLISGLERPDVLLIEDSLEQSGTGLLKAFLISLADRVDKIHLYLYDLTPECCTCDLPESVLEKLNVEDMTRDPFGWITGSASLSTMPQQPLVPAGKKAVLVIDSLNGLIKANSSSLLCCVLHQLAGRNSSASAGGTIDQIISLVHKDTLDAVSLKALEHVASCILNLSTTEGPVACSLCDTTIKYSTGKLTTRKEQFWVTKSYAVKTTEMSKQIPISSSKPSPDPTSNLTFRLTLRNEEKEAKRQVVLPYLSARDKENCKSREDTGQGLVTYEPDEADMEEEEEEDPDDDLDI